MHIDLFTFCVQIVNFLVLLFILNRILIKPLIASVENRRKNIIKQNEDIILKQNELSNEIKLYENKISDFENFKISERKKLDLEIQEQRNLKSIEIRKEFEKEREKFLNKFMSEKSSLVDNITESICLNLSNLLKKIFVDLADEDLEDKIIKKFIFKLKDINSLELEKIKNLNKDTKIVINSSFELSVDNKNAIINFLKDQDINNDLLFSQENGIILGIKMTADNIIINSNVQDIIEQFSSELKNVL